MGADPPEQLELATNDEWRRIMSARRKELGMTQAELGGRVGTSQNMISNIESGQVTSSKFVLPICRTLSIPPPMFFESEDQKAWSQLGHVLRHKSMKQFRRAMALVEAMVEDEDATTAEPAPSAPGTPEAPPRK